MLRRMLEARFGAPGPGAQERLEHLSPEQVDALAPALLVARLLQELGLED